jgi:AbrB family looped-hinge helix DNA binding protein
MKAIATVTSKGQLTLPKAVRSALGIHEGDTLEFEVFAGHAEIRPTKPWGSSAGALKHLLPKEWKAPTVEEMDQGIARAVSERNARSRR